MAPTNGTTADYRPLAWEDLHMATNQQLHNLDEKLDDIQHAVATLAIEQATMGGEVKVLATQLGGFKETFDDRLTKLEAARSRDEWRAWAERLAAALGGAGVLQLAQHFLGR